MLYYSPNMDVKVRYCQVVQSCSVTVIQYDKLILRFCAIENKSRLIFLHVLYSSVCRSRTHLSAGVGLVCPQELDLSACSIQVCQFSIKIHEH